MLANKGEKIVLRSGKILNEAFGPTKQINKDGRNGFLHMRCDSEETNSALWLDPAFAKCNGLNAEELERQNRKNINGHRPIHKIVDKSPGGRPLKVQSPEGTVYNRTTDFGFYIYFDSKDVDNQLRNGPITDIASPIKHGSALRNLKTPPPKQKYKKIHITKDSFEQVAIERQRNKNRRITDQQEALRRDGALKKNASADVQARELSLTMEEAWEWLHLIAYMILGEKGQTHDNLVGGAYHANTEMMFAEDVVKSLVTKFAKLYPNGIWLEVEADTISDTHIATNIRYTINAGDFILPFVFNAQTENRPNIKNKLYLNSVITNLVTATQERLQIEAEEVENNLEQVKIKSDDSTYKPSRSFFNPPTCKRKINFGGHNGMNDPNKGEKYAKKAKKAI